MTNLFKKIATSIIGMAMAIGVGIGLSTNSVKETKAAAGDTLVYTITQSSVTDYPSSYSTTETKWSQNNDGGSQSMSFALASHMKSNSSMQSQASNGYFRNTSIPSGYAIKSIVVNMTSGKTARQWSFFGSGSEIESTSGLTAISTVSSNINVAYGSGTTYDSTNYPYTYFRAVRGSNAYYADSYVVTLVKLDASAPSVQSVSVSGDMATKTYSVFEQFNEEGLTASVTMSSGTYSGDIDWSFEPTTPLNLLKANKDDVSNGEISAIASAGGKSGNKTISGINVSCATVAEAISNTPESGNKEVVVNGIVSQVDEIETSTYHNATYYISDDGTTTNQLKVFHGKNIDNTNFTNSNDLIVGDTVVIYGNLTTYSSTKELAQGNYLLKKTRPVTYTVTYDYNGGTGSPSSAVVAAGNSVSLPTPERLGYTFNGWKVLVESVPTGSYLVSPYTPEENVTLQAQWTAKTLNSIRLASGAPTKTVYGVGETFDSAGLVVYATWDSVEDTSTNIASSLVWTPNPLTAGTTSVIGTYPNSDKQVIVSGIVVNASTTITISGAGDSGKTIWKPTGDGDTFVDSLGNTETFNTDVPSAGFNGTGTPYQFGTNSNSGTYVTISIPISPRAGILSAGVKYCSSGATTTAECLIYGDTTNDVILSNSVTGITATEFATDNNYVTINASTLHFRFSFPKGCKIGYISYSLGATVQEFQTFTSLAVLNPTTDTQFKVGDTFSASNLVLRATDNVDFTKDYSNGFKFGTSEGNDSYTGYKFVASDVTNSPLTVYVSLTIGGITKSINYQITVTEVPSYSLINDYSTLYEGAKVILVAGSVAAGEHTGNYLTPVNDIVFTDNIITDASTATEFTVRIYGSRFALQFGSYYLSYSGDNNAVQRTTMLSDDCAWKMDGTGLLSNVDGRHLKYYSSDSKIACYADSRTAEIKLYISDKTPMTATLGAETYAYKYLHLRDYTVADGSCKNDSANHYYSTAKTAYGSLTADEKTEFAKLSNAVARLQDWARANSETFDPSTGFGSANISPIATSQSNNTSIIIVIISMLSITALGGFFFLRKRKEEK